MVTMRLPVASYIFLDYSQSRTSLILSAFFVTGPTLQLVVEAKAQGADQMVIGEEEAGAGTTTDTAPTTAPERTHRPPKRTTRGQEGRLWVVGAGDNAMVRPRTDVRVQIELPLSLARSMEQPEVKDISARREKQRQDQESYKSHADRLVSPEMQNCDSVLVDGMGRFAGGSVPSGHGY